jgi:hypothetical protein
MSPDRSLGELQLQFPFFLFCILGLLYKQCTRTMRLDCLYNNPKICLYNNPKLQLEKTVDFRNQLQLQKLIYVFSAFGL